MLNLNGFPRGTRTEMSHSGLKEVSLNGGRAMTLASTEA